MAKARVDPPAPKHAYAAQVIRRSQTAGGSARSTSLSYAAWSRFFIRAARARRVYTSALARDEKQDTVRGDEYSVRRARGFSTS